MTDTKLKKIVAAVDNFDHAMLVTERNGQLRSRPMVIGDTTADGRIRFITSDESGKVDEISERHEVNVALQGESKFLSISGTARLSKDPDLINESWKRSQGSWFSQGRNDPHVVVLEVIPGYAEYWDRSGAGVVRSVFDLARAALGESNDAPSADDQHHETDLSEKPL